MVQCWPSYALTGKSCLDHPCFRPLPQHLAFKFDNCPSTPNVSLPAGNVVPIFCCRNAKSIPSNLGWLRTIIYESEMALFSECTESCTKKCLTLPISSEMRYGDNHPKAVPFYLCTAPRTEGRIRSESFAALARECPVQTWASNSSDNRTWELRFISSSDFPEGTPEGLKIQSHSEQPQLQKVRPSTHVN
jgi:hypothetical protein